MAYSYNFKACEKDTCDMPLSSPSGLLKKQLDIVVIEEANKEESKLITSAGGKRSYTSSESYHCKVCSRTFASNSSSVIPAFSKAITPVTIDTRARACLTVVWWCPYILGFSLANTTILDDENRSNSQLQSAIVFQRIGFDQDLILYLRKFSTMNNLQYTVAISIVPFTAQDLGLAR